MSANPWVKAFIKVLSREEPEKMERCKEAIRDLVYEGFADVTVGAIALEFDQLNSE